MATLRKRNGKWHVEIRRKGNRKVYQTFVQKSDARSFINKTESDIQQKNLRIFQKRQTLHLKLLCRDTSEKK